jgi:signal peptidase I
VSPGHLRRLLETAGLLLCVLLILRVLGSEPYSVPTGSMAPTLLGNHQAVNCPRCGYPVLVGAPNGEGRRHGLPSCPNCGCTELELDHVPVSRGDQLLVNKNVFDFRRPRRWEVAVFRCPADPGKEFVKRIIGLPGESVLLWDGDVYIDHELARKSLAEFKRLRIPVFDNNHQPSPDGWAPRWEAQPAGAAVALEGTALRLSGSARPDDYLWLRYRHWSLDEHREVPVRDAYSYNGGEPAAASAVHDFMLECDVELLGGDGWVAFGITDGHDEFIAEVPVGAVKEGSRLRGRQPGEEDKEETVYRTAPDFGLRSGKTYRVEFAFVDRRATLAIDGRCPFAPVDRPAVERRDAVVRPVQIGTRGVEVRVRNVRLFRDVHYTEAGRHGVRRPLPLGAGEYFVLGDNSPNSDDSRFWSDAAGQPLPVRAEDFVGKPFLVHLPSRAVEWHWLGRQWQHQTIDWQRMRWLR